MSAKSKLNQARKAIHARQIKKTGYNSFSRYDFFELSDFLMPALEIFDSLNLSGVVSFGTELATMTITDLDDEQSPFGMLVITSPMSTADLKACHAVQNLGAVETYIRRYLWVVALEIVEHDAIDTSDGPAEKGMSPTVIANDVIRRVKNKDTKGAALDLSRMDQDKIELVWAKLDPEVIDQLTAVWPA